MSDVFLVEDAIARPDEPRHIMRLETLPYRVEAYLGGHQLAISDRCIKLKEVGYHIYDPVIYFPKQDVRTDWLHTVDFRTFCPLKGHTQYYDVVVAGHKSNKAAWSYVELLAFNGQLSQLTDRIAFDLNSVQLIERTTEKAA